MQFPAQLAAGLGHESQVGKIPAEDLHPAEHIVGGRDIVERRYALVFKQIPEFFVHDAQPGYYHDRTGQQTGAVIGQSIGIVQRQRGDSPLCFGDPQVHRVIHGVNKDIAPGLTYKLHRPGGAGGGQQLAELRKNRILFGIVRLQQHIVVNRPELLHVRIMFLQQPGSKDHSWAIGIHDVPAHVFRHSGGYHQHRVSAVDQRGIAGQGADAVFAQHHGQLPRPDPGKLILQFCQFVITHRDTGIIRQRGPAAERAEIPDSVHASCLPSAVSSLFLIMVSPSL